MTLRTDGASAGRATRMNQEARKLRAIRVVYEIIRQSPGDAFDGKTRLFKAFYFAHLYYAKQESRLLSSWPIVRMPNGPGIGNFQALLKDLLASNLIRTEVIEEGPYSTTRYSVTDVDPSWEPLSAGELQAIRDSARYVSDKNAAHLSAITHDMSRAWINNNDGDEINVFDDIVEEEVYQDERARAQSLEEAFEKVWA